MLDQYSVGPTLAASDLERAKQWYADKLGLTPTMETEGSLVYPSAGRSMGFAVYLSPNAGTNRATYAAWVVDNLDAVMAALRGRGLTFEEYDTPEVKTVDTVATSPEGSRTAWFVDSEGNILSLIEVSS